MAARGYVVQSRRSGGYLLGHRTLELRGPVQRRTARLRRVARPHLERARRVCGETISLAVPVESTSVLWIDEVMGAPPAIPRLGRCLPAHASAAGKALLADARERGFAIEDEDLEPGSSRSPRRSRWMARRSRRSAWPGRPTGCTASGSRNSARWRASSPGSWGPTWVAQRPGRRPRRRGERRRRSAPSGGDAPGAGAAARADARVRPPSERRRSVTVSERGLEDRREDPREHDRQRQHQGDRDDERRNTLGDPARHDLLVDDDDDRAVGQVQAVGRRAEVADRPRFEQAKKRGRPAGRQTGQETRDGRSQREVDPEQVVERPHRALPPDQREHGRGGGGREPGPRPRPASRAGAHDAGGHDADREQRGEVGRRLDHEDVQAGDVRAQDPHRRHDGASRWRA